MSRARAKRDRVALDYYPTPKWPIRRFLEAAAPLLPLGTWLEPCVGCGRIPSVVSEYVGPSVEWVTADIDPKHRADFHQDYLRPDIIYPRGYFDHIMTNPPFSLALEFAKRSLEISPAVTLLLRLGFLETEERRDFVAETKPHLWVLPQRPSFHGGGNDSATYAWFSWGIGTPGAYTMLAQTPRKDKKR